MRLVADVIMPFPGGIARSGSKVGSKYKGLRASTNTAFAPLLRGLVPGDLPPEVRCIYEIVIDGLTLEAVEQATLAGLDAVARPGSGLIAITSGNYGGKLGPYHIRLHDVVSRMAGPEQPVPGECVDRKG
jgi:formylmethanofuran--tetrahydromethanopterin N-formyltransferase